MSKQTCIGLIPDEFGSFLLREKLTRNDAGEWGADPDEHSCGVLRSTNFTNEGILDLSDVALRSLSATKRRQKSIQEGDIIIERSGGSDNQPVGRVGYITVDIGRRGYSFSNFIQRISLHGSLNPKFVFYCLQRMHEMGVTLGMQTQTTGIRNLDYKFYIRSRLPEPARNEQDSIVAALESVDQAMAATRDTIAKAERLHKGLMQQLLAGSIKPDGMQRHESDFESDDRLGLFPKGWKVRKLREVVRLKNGKSNITSNLREKSDATFRYPVFGGNGMTGWSDRYLLESATIVLGRVGEYCGVVHRTPPKAWVTDNALYASEFPEPVDLDFLFCLLVHLRLNRWKATTGQPKITQSEILNIRVAIPTDTTEQTAIAAKFYGLRQLIEAKHTKIATFQRLKKSLMQKLLTGRIRVPVNGGAKKANS